MEPGAGGKGFSFWDLFLFYVIASTLIPFLKQELLKRARLLKLREIERSRGTRVISLIHRQEALALFGLPFYKFITIDDSEELIRAIRLTKPELPIDLILHTPGGLVLASEQIARALEKHPAKVTVFVPHYAMSGGTLVALAADEIVMDDNALLGPVDPQLNQYPAGSIMRVQERKPPEKIDDNTWILIDIAEKAVKQMEASVYSLLLKSLTPQRARELAELLTHGRFTHDYGIGAAQAKEIGLPVSTDMPRAIFDYMDLFPQGTHRNPSVNYIPLPYDEKPTSNVR